MDAKKYLTNVTIKQEPNTSTAKKILLSNSTLSTLSTKNVTNARLPSFKPPRDLFLTGSVTGSANSSFNVSSNNKGTKRTYIPNVNVTRKKGSRYDTYKFFKYFYDETNNLIINTYFSVKLLLVIQERILTKRIKMMIKIKEIKILKSEMLMLYKPKEFFQRV